MEITPTNVGVSWPATLVLLAMMMTQHLQPWRSGMHECVGSSGHVELHQLHVVSAVDILILQFWAGLGKEAKVQAYAEPCGKITASFACYNLFWM